MGSVRYYPDGPRPPSTAVPVEVAMQEATRILSVEDAGTISLGKDMPHTFRDGEVYENAGYRLCSLLEDCDNYAGREQAE